MRAEPLLGPDGSGMALRGACLLLCLLSLAQVSGQQNGKARQKPAASKKGKGQQQLLFKGDLQGLGGLQSAHSFGHLTVLY